MPFEKFTNNSSMYDTEPNVSIGKNTHIRFNKTLINNYPEIDFYISNTYCELFLNKESMLIGFIFSKEKKDHSYKLIKYNKNSFFISGKSFFKNSKIDLEKILDGKSTKRYPIIFDEEKKMVIINLK